jgi:eukaryotic-like serine/threonine-protein kinase
VTPPDSEDDYVAFTRRMLDDLAAGRRQSADYYAKLFPGAAEQIREEVDDPTPTGASRRKSSVTEIRLPGADDDTDPALHELPARVGRYDVTGELPSGGMGRLLLARHPETGAQLVVKTAKPGLVALDSNTLERLRREATILGRLDHDRICPVTDVVVEGDRVFVVMPFIEGETLERKLAQASARLRQGAQPSSAWRTIGAAAPGAAAPQEPAEAKSGPIDTRTAYDARSGLRAVLGFMEEVARAIHAAHEKGVIHRDLKPGNVMVRPDGHPVVLDFGLAVDLSDLETPRLTVRGDLIGTPSYMAPEQINSDVDAIDRRTDVYALGVVLYELLTFRRAFRGNDFQTIRDLVVNGRIDGPREVNPTIPRDLEAVCLKAMDAEQGRRYATALDFAEDLRRVRTLEATTARPVTGIERLVLQVRRHPAWSTVALILLAAIVAAAAWLR